LTPLNEERVNSRERERRRERAIACLIRAAESIALPKGDCSVALVHVGIALVHIMALGGPEAADAAYGLAQDAVRGTEKEVRGAEG
jgi:hypothetical protein